MPLTSDVARHVGDPVAVVMPIARMRRTDGAEKVRVDWEPLPSVTATESASTAGAPKIHGDAPGTSRSSGPSAMAPPPTRPSRAAAVTVKKRIINQRLVANAMEPRACVASFSPALGELTLWVTSQNPHVHRLLMCAFVLGIPEHKVRVIAPDVGGGFRLRSSSTTRRSCAPGRRASCSAQFAGLRVAAKRIRPTPTGAIT